MYMHILYLFTCIFFGEISCLSIWIFESLPFHNKWQKQKKRGAYSSSFWKFFQKNYLGFWAYLITTANVYIQQLNNCSMLKGFGWGVYNLLIFHVIILQGNVYSIQKEFWKYGGGMYVYTYSLSFHMHILQRNILSFNLDT